ncbi:hypothetical protein ACSBR1_028882 [Camellia fascicularis]
MVHLRSWPRIPCHVLEWNLIRRKLLMNSTMNMEGLWDLVLEDITIQKRKLCNAQGINVDVADDTGISLKASHDLVSALAGGNEFVGFTREDQKTYLRAKRQQNLQYGEAGSLLRHFQQ